MEALAREVSEPENVATKREIGRFDHSPDCASSGSLSPATLF